MTSSELVDILRLRCCSKVEQMILVAVYESRALSPGLRDAKVAAELEITQAAVSYRLDRLFRRDPELPTLLGITPGGS